MSNQTLKTQFNNIEIIEHYPQDEQGYSSLLLGFTKSEKPIHYVVSFLDEEELLIVTMYRPDPARWLGFRKRKKP